MTFFSHFNVLPGSSGFLLPESELLPVGHETWDAVCVVFDAVLAHNELPPVPSQRGIF